MTHTHIINSESVTLYCVSRCHIALPNNIHTVQRRSLQRSSGQADLGGLFMLRQVCPLFARKPNSLRAVSHTKSAAG